MTQLSAKYVIIGAGIHGLSTAYHLGKILQARGESPEGKILVVDKTSIGAGASGIACGVVRNNYFQPAMRELMAHSVACWEDGGADFGYHSVGYMQISPESMHNDVAQIAKQQADIGYESTFIEGEKESMDYMKTLFHDWQAQGITSVLHEKKGGYAHNTKALYAMASRAEALGAKIMTGVTVQAINTDSNTQAAKSITTNKGDIAFEHLVVAVGPWARSMWNMLSLPERIDITDAEGNTHKDNPMWTYWSLQEGTLGVDPSLQVTNDGKMPPVLHVDSDAPLYSDEDGSLITDKMWGIYYKPDTHFGGVQGGAAPFIINKTADEVAVDPYGVDSPEFIVGKDFAHMWTSALAHCQKRFSGQAFKYKKEPSGGIGAFTPDSFPVFDVFNENVYFLADSNHGYKMIGVGKLVAEELTSGVKSDLMKPFLMSRYQTGKLHPVSNSPFPWS
ncbi:NAD(P)/FAD-dependent oxidoreductase [Ostreibacterium oceani]|uniref:FAD-dependent oxidoreductase n=1 Tax=Ostreibacterium oceani TaxID=2654998 RepID=A0A6N7EYE6_9GAMM|nr:FAD-dependent oxidoreductase [Ostreibacterium oceani]